MIKTDKHPRKNEWTSKTKHKNNNLSLTERQTKRRRKSDVLLLLCATKVTKPIKMTNF